MKTETIIILSTAAALVVAFIATAVGAIRKSTANPEPEQPEPATITAKIDTAIPRPPKVVRAPEGCAKYLTSGKEYSVTYSVECTDDAKEYAFYIHDNFGFKVQCFEKKCIHLNGGDWIVVEREGEEKQQPKVEQQLLEAQAEATRLAGELEKEKQKHEDYKKQAIDILQLRVEETAAVEKQRYEARALANDLRGCLDEALDKLKAVQADVQRTEKLFRDNGLLTEGKHALRGKDGKFRAKTKGDHLESLIGGDSAVWNEKTQQWEGLHSGKKKEFMPPQPVKHLREVNAELLERPDNSEPGEQAQPAELPDVIDWSKPVAFPRGYIVPKGIRIVCLEDADERIKIGTKGVTTQSSDLPYCDFDNSTENYGMCAHELAPLNPADHPWHPEFKGNKTENN